VRPFINARGTWTYISGSMELPEVRIAKQRASEHFVDMFELQRAVGKRLADLSGAESGLITAGAAAAMATATAACFPTALVRSTKWSCLAGEVRSIARFGLRVGSWCSP